MNNLTWTESPPTESGWYWAKSITFRVVDEPKEFIEIVEVEVGSDGVDVYAIGDDCGWKLSASPFTHWLGPLPIPDSPISS